MLKKISFFIVLAIFFLFRPAYASAAEFKSGDDITIPQNQTIDSTLFVAGNNIRIDGTINGELYCAGNNIVINGIVKGSVYCAGQNISLNNQIVGDVKVAGETISVDGDITGHMMSFGQTIEFNPDSSVGRDLTVAGQKIVLEGNIGRDVSISGDSVSVNGNIGRDLTVKTGTIALANTTKVVHNFNYQSTNQVKVSKEQVGGTVSYSAPNKQNSREKNQNTFMDWVMNLIYTILSSLFISFLFIMFLGDRLKDITTYMRKRAFSSIGWGLVYLIIVPIVILLILITIIGIPAAIILTLIYIISLMISTTLFGLMLGQFITQKYFPEHRESLWYIVSTGVLASSVLFKLPIVGGLAVIVAFFWGLGGIFNYFNSLMHRAV